MSSRDEVGIRDLRQNLKAALARVESGERLVITSHNRPIARLVPFAEDDPLQRLIDGGVVTPPAAPPAEFEPLKLDGVTTDSLLQALEYVRGDH